tara:strand:- start:1104 stop:2318 length:1215 start_codon:yes stop_codon:yes gene_type:complete
MEENNENVIEEITQQTNQGDPGDEHVEKIDKSKFNSADDESVAKIDLSKPPTPKEEINETKENNADDSGVVAESENAEPTQKQEEVQPEAETQEAPVVEEITAEEQREVEETTEVVEEAIAESQATGKPLPENIQKLMDFMDDTGGSLDDYVRLNKDFSKYSPVDLVREYYSQTKPHLTSEEVAFMMNDQFGYDKDVDEENEIKRKQLAMKEQVAQAKSYLEGRKSKYYRDLKAGVKLTPDQQKAIDFFNRYNKETQQAQKQEEIFLNNYHQKTEQVFNDKFKGFEYNVGDKRFRFNINNAEEVRNAHDDVDNFIQSFVNKKTGTLENAQGYHKALYTAMNADAIAQHFYEQGRADAMKNSIAKSKNIDMNPRQQHGEAKTGGPQVRVLGDNVASFKIKNKFKK